jgi:hypothetical protein
MEYAAVPAYGISHGIRPYCQDLASMGSKQAYIGHGNRVCVILLMLLVEAIQLPDLLHDRPVLLAVQVTNDVIIQPTSVDHILCQTDGGQVWGRAGIPMGYRHETDRRVARHDHALHAEPIGHYCRLYIEILVQWYSLPGGLHPLIRGGRSSGWPYSGSLL